MINHSGPPTLYHYCSNDTFSRIISGKSLYLSSVRLSNDSMEGRWLQGIFQSVCVDDKLPEWNRQRLLEHIDLLGEFSDGLAFCLSEKSDMLSQWRGYASDGTGVSIGFSASYLSSREFIRDMEGSFPTLHKVEYDKATQIQAVLPLYRLMRERIDAGALDLPGLRGILDTRSPEEIEEDDERKRKEFSALSMTMLGALGFLYKFKNPAFAEESEWRLLVHSGAFEATDFLGRGDRLVPFKKFEFMEETERAIDEVVLGPKNITPERVVKSALNRYGFGDVTVRRSASTYR